MKISDLALIPADEPDAGSCELITDDEFTDDEDTTGEDLCVALSLLDRWMWVGLAIGNFAKKHNLDLSEGDIAFELGSVINDTSDFVLEFDTIERKETEG